MIRETHYSIGYTKAVKFTFLVTEMFTVRHLFLLLLESGPFCFVTDPPLCAVDSLLVQLSSARLCFWPHGDSQDVHSLQNSCISVVENYYSEMSSAFVTSQRPRLFQLDSRFQTELDQESFKRTHRHMHSQNFRKDTAI